MALTPLGLFDSRFLDSARIQTIIETLASERERLRPLVYLDRLDLVEASDDDIMGRFTAKQFAADIIADDQKALVYEAGQVELIVNQLANIKIGQTVGQAQLNLMERLKEGMARTTEENALLEWEYSFGDQLLTAVRERMNQMACGMMIDSLSYNRWGLQLNNITWGMPAEYKVTTSVAWTDTTNAKPLDDIQSLDQIDFDKYGAGPFDRITMSSQAFRYLVNTDQFRFRANLVMGVNFILQAGMIPVKADPMNYKVFENILGKELVIDDKTIRESNNAGVTTATRVLPANKVLLDRKANGRREWDFGNAVVTESIVSNLIGAGVTLGTNPKIVGDGAAYGPLAYYTAQSPDLNPPGVTGWSIARGFPRKHVVEGSAVLTVF